MSSAWLENMAASGALLIEEEEEEEETTVNDVTPEKISDPNELVQLVEKPKIESKKDDLKEEEEMVCVKPLSSKYYYGPSNKETVNFAKNFTKVKAIQRLEYGSKLNFVASSLTEAKESAARPLRITGDITSASTNAKEKYAPLKEKIMKIPIPSKAYVIRN